MAENLNTVPDVVPPSPQLGLQSQVSGRLPPLPSLPGLSSQVVTTSPTHRPLFVRHPTPLSPLFSSTQVQPLPGGFISEDEADTGETTSRRRADSPRPGTSADHVLTLSPIADIGDPPVTDVIAVDDATDSDSDVVEVHIDEEESDESSSADGDVEDENSNQGNIAGPQNVGQANPPSPHAPGGSNSEPRRPPGDGQETPGPPVAPSLTLQPAIQLIQDQGESPIDFRSPKRRRIISPVKKDSGKDGADEGEEDDGNCCPICFELWTTSGGHRIASLKCGHLFGQSCIEKWLKGQGGKCPQCNAKAKRQDVRVIYAKSIKALDTSERDRALKDLEKEKEIRRKLEMDGAQTRLQYQLAIEECNKMKLELEKARQQIHASGQSSSGGTGGVASSQRSLSVSGSQLTGQFVQDKTIKIWDAGNCRVMAYSSSLATLVVSQPSSSPLFPGFGVKKISCLDFKSSQYLTVHSKAIRDVSFHPTVEDGMLLSCGLDKKVKMTSLHSNAIVQSYDTPVAAWSCVWNCDDRNYFFAGLQNGTVLQFDIRNTEGPVGQLNQEGSRSPVAALKYIPYSQQSAFRPGGLLAGQLDRVTFFEARPEAQHRLHILPVEGSLTSLHVDAMTRHILCSFRPTAKHPTIRHQMCELSCTSLQTDPGHMENVCSCNTVQAFHGGRTQTVLSRTMMLPHPSDGNRLLVCAGDESSNGVHIWDSGSGQFKQRMSAGGIVLDLCAININNGIYLAALTDKQLKVFRWC